MIYAGDHDPTGEDIDRDFENRVGLFDHVHRIALNEEQLTEYEIPKNVLDPEVVKKLENDPRSERFKERHGYLDQYELDALDPNDLRNLYRSAIEHYWDADAHQRVLDQEEDDKAAFAEDEE